MNWAYGIENNTVIVRNNKPLFFAIQSMGIEERYRFFDRDESRTELNKLLEQIGKEDRLFIRSLEDLADNFDDLIFILTVLTEKRIALCSLQESYLSECNYLEVVKNLADLIKYFQIKKRTTAYKTAVGEGRVGRPKAANAERYIDLFIKGELTKKEVIEMAAISEPTFYRYLSEQKGEKENADT